RVVYHYASHPLQKIRQNKNLTAAEPDWALRNADGLEIFQSRDKPWLWQGWDLPHPGRWLDSRFGAKIFQCGSQQRVKPVRTSGEGGLKVRTGPRTSKFVDEVHEGDPPELFILFH